MANLDLLSTTSRVEAPFIIAKIAGYSFGLYNRYTKNIIDETGSYNGIATDYPNYMTSLAIKKINGTLNTYTLIMRYAIRPGEDPNLLEKVFSKAKNDRTMYLTYGDSSVPAFIYKEEKTLITGIKNNFDLNSSTITYTISAVSQALGLIAGTHNFPARTAKPSDVIKELLYNKKYGLTEVFTAMVDKDKVISKGLITSDDISVKLESKKDISIFNYLNYLVSCMRSAKDSSSTLIKNNKYILSVFDDISGEWQGTYFKISKVDNSISNINSLDTYEIDVGFQSSNIVTSFTLDDDETYSILYDYSGKINHSEYVYRLDDEGKMETVYSPNITKSKTLKRTTEADKNWWSNVTQYPISGKLTIKGLLKPSILMTYIKLNVLFYGRKHISSGYYIITSQTDMIDATGYRTTLALTRIHEDDN